MRVDPTELPSAIRRPLVGGKAHEELLRHLSARLPRLEGAPSREDWTRRAAAVHRAMTALIFRGHPAGLLRGRFAAEWRGIAFSGPGYRVRKVRFEGYPGLWVPALLYEPWPTARFPGRLPVVLNPNGHHGGGKAMDYKQARCINLAKRGVLALNFEFLGMGELSDSRLHNRIAQLDLAGVAGIGVFYLIMKRALDLLLSHPRADGKRAGMTGLSGGGWQTILLSSLDRRITASVPVAGHTAVWQRIRHREDMGDLEQIPSDFCTVADYDVLSAMLAPRPALFIYNRNDDCCFRTERARLSVLRPARRIYQLLGAGDRMESHDNADPGTHNYERDNRRRFYGFLNGCFGLDGPEDDLPWEDELLSEERCRVGLPAGNATLLSLAARKAEALQRAHAASRRKAPTAAALRAARQDLAEVLRLPHSAVESVRSVSSRRMGDVTVRQSVAVIDGSWSVPLALAHPLASRTAHARAAKGTEGAAAFRFRGGETVLAAGDGGRQAALASVMRRCCGASTTPAPAPAHVAAADVFGTGELAVGWQEHMILAGTGERPLGIQVAQLLALARWARSAFGARRVSLHVSGLVLSVAGLLAAALEPPLFAELVTDQLPDSFRRLIDWPVEYEQAAPLFCFGLFARFDIPGLIAMCHDVPIRDPGRGPLGRDARRTRAGKAP